MPVEVVSIPTDTTPLDGLLYLPDDGNVRASAQLMHGNTMNFYVGPLAFLPRILVELGIACLAYNRRGHDVLSNRSSRRLEGGAFQTIAEAIEDNRLAAQWMKARGFPPPFVIGHSNGGTLAVRHVADHRDTPGLVLLSAHRGGKDLMRMMADNGLMAGNRFAEITSTAQSLVAEGRGDELMLVPGWWYVISARTYVEFLEHCPDIIAWSDQIPCPTLYIRDIGEPTDLYPGEGVARRSNRPFTLKILDAGGHYYSGGEQLIAETIGQWLSPLV